jgi:hypothetical protein
VVTGSTGAVTGSFVEGGVHVVAGSTGGGVHVVVTGSFVEGGVHVVTGSTGGGVHVVTGSFVEGGVHVVAGSTGAVTGSFVEGGVQVVVGVQVLGEVLSLTHWLLRFDECLGLSSLRTVKCARNMLIDLQ